MGIIIIFVVFAIVSNWGKYMSVPDYIADIFIAIVLGLFINFAFGLFSIKEISYVSNTQKQIIRPLDNTYIVPAGKDLNYFIDTEAGLEIKGVPASWAIVNHVDIEEPYFQRVEYKYKNPIVNFLFVNYHILYEFYIPEGGD